MSLFYKPREARIVYKKPRKGKSLADAEDYNRTETFSCDLCTDEYDSETELHLHRRSRHRAIINKMLMDNLVCRICVKKYETNDDLLKHIKTQHLLSSEDAEYVEREIYLCDICDLFYFNKHMLSIHMQYYHDPNKKKLTTDCPKCDKKVPIKHVWFHFQRHLIQSVVCCPICLKKCKSQKNLNEHVREHPSCYRCNLCGYDTKYKELFLTHMQSHKSDDVDMVDDSVLKRCFSLKPHKRKTDFNFGVRGLKLCYFEICILCRALCTEETKAEHAMQFHVVERAVAKKQYMCVCGESFFNNVLLKHHVFKLKGEHKPCLSVNEGDRDVIRSTEPTDTAEAELVSDPSTEPTDTAEAEVVTDPSTEPTDTAETEVVTDPSTEPTDTAEAEVVTEPGTEPTDTAEAEVVTDPSTEPMDTAEAEVVTNPSTDQASGSSD